ncbi:hypothetical protein GCM10017083_44300 [Thalassobaculum fulvum]|uniref:diguanylate cyclase n=1 Tax=Thalassobaculum fulvum TaxID=1633335 RepID=A0A919CRU8_9PROT|nr:GGDEF domain-containing protein [Thalassobaculum fulvum]GHD59645.1 hypothetical protein GCM10017083_44300 [Thalassobaculum fulvum]
MIESLDVRTLAVVTSLVLVSVTGVLTIVYFTQRVYAGFAHWLGWQAAVTLGVILFALRGPDPAPAVLMLNQVLLLLSPALLFDGLTRFHGLYPTRTPALINYALVGVALLLQVEFTIVAPDPDARIAVYAVTRAIIQLRCAGEPLRLASARRSPAFWLLVGILLLLSATELNHAWRALQPGPMTALLDSDNVRVALILAIVGDILAAYGLVLLTNERLEGELRAARHDIEMLARTDSLTGLWNRRHFEDTVEAEVERARRYGTPLSLLTLDADHFKRINDSHGHHVGDDVLRELARLLGQQIRRSDLLCRWGGEEFMVLVPGTDGDRAAAMAEKIRQRVAAHVFDGVGPVTVSIGVGQAGPDETADAWLRRVDAALYEAKQRGRNRVVVATGIVPAVPAA